MLSLLEFNWPVLAAALLIGVATARWLFRRPPVKKDEKDPTSP